jgi:thiol:disulfide interchange protein DsbD
MRARIAVAICLLLMAAVAAGAQVRRVTADVAALVESDGVHPGSVVRAALVVRLPEGYHVNSDKPRDPSLIPTVLTVDAPAGVSVTEVVFPASTDLKQAGQDQPLAVFEREFRIGVALTIGRDVARGDLVVPARLRYQACDATMCYIPATVESRWTLRVVPESTPITKGHADVFAGIAFGRGGAAAGSLRTDTARGGAEDDGGLSRLDDFSILATSGGYLGTSDFLRFIRDAETGVKPRSVFEGRGPLAILLIVFVGGLALNLTPCVLPMIPINLAIIGAGAQAGSRARGLLLGAAYGGAMALVYGVLGLIVILTAGTFGTINSSPWFNLAIAALFVVLALAMFDVVTIDFSGLSSNFRPGAGRGSLLLAFSMGAVAALLAGACVAPVVIQVVLFSSNLYGTGTTSALCLPFVLGIGMAVPWPIAGAGLASLPKPGMWMVRVKQAMGVLILATAAYYGYEAYGLFANQWVDRSAVASSVQEKVKAGWHASLGEGLAAARRDRKPVLIDLWATWCKNCLTMDKTTLEDPTVRAALDNYVKIKFQAEEPDQQPAKAVMQRFGAVGLPTYVILRPKPDRSVRNADPF